MVLVLFEWLKELLSLSWNQRNTKKKKTVMGLTSIKLDNQQKSILERNLRKGKVCKG